MSIVPVQRAETDAAQALITALAHAHVHGIGVDWTAVLPARRPVELPTYAFQRQRYWPQPARGPAVAGVAAETAAEAKFWAAVSSGDLAALADTVGGAESLSPDMPLAAALALLSSWRQAQQPAAQAGAAEDPGTAPSGWAERLAGLPSTERQRQMLEIVRGETAAVLGYESAGMVEADGDVLDLGMSSVSAVELHERLAELIGLDLPAGFIYDLSTPAAIAEFLVAELTAAEIGD
jgi:acyl transferase domain-containing protein